MNSVQNRFTAYLVAAVTNQRIHYMERKRHLQNLEFVQNDLQEKNYLDFDTQYHDYLVYKQKKSNTFTYNAFDFIFFSILLTMNSKHNQ